MRRLSVIVGWVALAVLAIGTARADIFQNSITTPAITNTSLTVSNKFTNTGSVTFDGIVRRLVIAAPNSGLTTPSTGTVQLIDFDGTILLQTPALTNRQNVSGTTTTFVGQAFTTNGTWYASRPTLVLTNASHTNLTATGTITFEK